MIKRLSALMLSSLVLAALITVPNPTRVQAQAGALSYDEPVEGEITASQKSVSFTLAGEEGDFILLQVQGTQEEGLFGGNLSISDPGDTVIGDSSELIIFGRTGEVLGVELTESGDYTVTVSVRDDSTSVGNFVLYATRATVLEVDGEPVTGQIESATQDQVALYTAAYILESRDDVTLNYELIAGDYTPFVVVHIVERGQNLFARGYLGGELVSAGSVTIAGSRDIRFITVGPFSPSSRGFGSSAVDAEYTLSVTAAE